MSSNKSKLQSSVVFTGLLIEGRERLEWLRDAGLLSDHFHAHPDGRVDLASDEAEIGLSHQTLEGGVKFVASVKLRRLKRHSVGMGGKLDHIH